MSPKDEAFVAMFEEAHRQHVEAHERKVQAINRGFWIRMGLLVAVLSVFGLPFAMKACSSKAGLDAKEGTNG